MLKKHMAACLVATAFMTIPALAQTSPNTAGAAGNQPATTAQSGSGSQGASSAQASGRFVTTQQPNQWRASKLIGINVYGADNERIGDINEVLVDRQGNADAVVVGVGGFLGIGEKNVALPFNAFEWVMEDTRRTASASGTGQRSSDRPATADRTASATAPAASGDRPSTTASTAAGAPATTPAGPTAGSPNTTATMAPRSDATTTSSTARSDAPTTGAMRSDTSASGARASSAERGFPDHAVLRMTKADLQNAPTFNYVGEQRSSDDRSGASRGGASGTANPPANAPRQ
jgi:hypothetical protein